MPETTPITLSQLEVDALEALGEDSLSAALRRVIRETTLTRELAEKMTESRYTTCTLDRETAEKLRALSKETGLKPAKVLKLLKDLWIYNKN